MESALIDLYDEHFKIMFIEINNIIIFYNKKLLHVLVF